MNGNNVVFTRAINSPLSVPHAAYKNPQWPIIELSCLEWKSLDNFTCGCKWSPDGRSILTSVNLDGLHVLDVPGESAVDGLLPADESLPDRARVACDLHRKLRIPYTGLVYDYVWYPMQRMDRPETCMFLTTRQHEPLQMWDSFYGALRGTYRGVDNCGADEAAISCVFTIDGCKIVAGYKKSIKIFHTNRPGSAHAVFWPVPNTVSCFAQVAESDNQMLAGDWRGSVNLYDMRAIAPSGRGGSSIRNYEGHTGAVTHLRYCRPYTFLSGARRDNSITHWDVRNNRVPLRVLNRTVSTNQRIYFDLSPMQNWLISGDTTGLLHYWDMRNDYKPGAIPIYGDSCNGVQFHPRRQIIATSGGQRQIPKVPLNDSDHEEDKDKGSKNKSIDEGATGGEQQRKKPENKVSLWWYKATI